LTRFMSFELVRASEKLSNLVEERTRIGAMLVRHSGTHAHASALVSDTGSTLRQRLTFGESPDAGPRHDQAVAARLCD
jgi:hypothetical protein